VSLAQGRAEEALAQLRLAVQAWQVLEAPYESARSRVLLGRAYFLLGDPATGNRELDVAEAAFRRLGARLDARAVAMDRQPGQRDGGITEREAQVLGLVAAGKSNQEIGNDLFISPRTVARHLENTFAKLSISTRAEAAVWAIEHGIVLRRGQDDPLS
jgi:DNA-binding CsgD family transcriptional regulator